MAMDRRTRVLEKKKRQTNKEGRDDIQKEWKCTRHYCFSWGMCEKRLSFYSRLPLSSPLSLFFSFFRFTRKVLTTKGRSSGVTSPVHESFLEFFNYENFSNYPDEISLSLLLLRKLRNFAHQKLWKSTRIFVDIKYRIYFSSYAYNDSI